jgi:hypothetical protein
MMVLAIDLMNRIGVQEVDETMMLVEPDGDSNRCPTTCGDRVDG